MAESDKKTFTIPSHSGFREPLAGEEAGGAGGLRVCDGSRAAWAGRPEWGGGGGD